METSTSKEKFLYHLSPIADGGNVRQSVLSFGRSLVGRADNCDVVISAPNVSSIHAVIEVTGKGAKIYDMNSKNGTYHNGEKVITTQINVGDRIRFGAVEFVFEKYSAEKTSAPLDILEPSKGEASPLSQSLPVSIPDVTETKTVVEETKEEEIVPSIVYPLSSDPKADYSEYIFEDSDEIHPIFKYDHSRLALEVIILFNDLVYSVDFIPDEDGVYKIVGARPEENEVEFSYLGKDEKVDFIEVSSGNCIINQLHSYKTTHITDDGISDSNSGRINLQDNDIVRLENGDLEIYIRKVSSPPSVAAPPFFKRDKELWKYILLLVGFMSVFLAATVLYEIDTEKEEKDPERIARILYKQPLKVSKNKTVESTKKAKPKKQKTKKVVVKKKTEKPKPKVTKPKNTAKKKVTTPGSKTAKKVQKVKRVKKPAPKAKTVAKKTAASSSKSSRTKNQRRSNRPSKNKGTIDVYKSIDFRSTVSSLAAKGGALQGATTAAVSSSDITGASIGGGVATNVKKANIGNEVGSLTGAASGKLAQSKGTEGLATSTGAYVAGIPSETVVLGSMDPDVIRRILREHLPQFRYCYQKELDKRANNTLSGQVKFLFTIGASGHVTKAGVQSSSLPSNVRGCAVRVLRGIKFPRPLGGGTVNVKQPFNFYPKRV